MYARLISYNFMYKLKVTSGFPDNVTYYIYIILNNYLAIRYKPFKAKMLKIH